jgi:hypothetical protein
VEEEAAAARLQILGSDPGHRFQVSEQNHFPGSRHCADSLTRPTGWVGVHGWRKGGGVLYSFEFIEDLEGSIKEAPLQLEAWAMEKVMRVKPRFWKLGM